MAYSKLHGSNSSGSFVSRLFHIGITVEDIEKAIDFFTNVMGMTLELSSTDWFAGEALEKGVGIPGAVLRVAVVKIPQSGERIELLEYKTPPSTLVKPLLPNDIGSMHIAFQVNDIFKWVQRLRKVGLIVHSEPNLNQSGYFGGYYWTYFKDPLGNTFELIALNGSDPSGDPRIEKIYHIGVTVSDLNAALDNYVNNLGCTLDYPPSDLFEGEVLEKGVGVAGAKLRLAVVSFGKDEKKIELLQYATPASSVREPLLPNEKGAMHIAFQVEMDSALRELRGKNVVINADPPNINMEGYFQSWYWTYLRDSIGMTHEILGMVPNFYSAKPDMLKK